MDLKYPLERFGLSEKEIKVYLEILPLGTISLQKIAAKTNLPRSTAYHVLNYLVNKGLVSTIIKNNITYYTASDPDTLNSDLLEKQNLISSILPQLKTLKSTITNPSSVQIYEGFAGVQTILSDLCKIKQQVYYFGGYKKSLSILKHLPDYVRRQRIEKEIFAKVIYDPIDEPLIRTKEYKKVTDLRFLKDFEEWPVMIFIYGTKVSMFSFKSDLVGIIIDNKDFAAAMKFIFDIYWDKSMPADKYLNQKKY